MLFISDHYFWQIGRLRIRLPAWMTPGRLTVGHVDCDQGWFAFTLELEHWLFGEMIHQTAMFQDAGISC